MYIMKRVSLILFLLVFWTFSRSKAQYYLELVETFTGSEPIIQESETGQYTSSLLANIFQNNQEYSVELGHKYFNTQPHMLPMIPIITSGEKLKFKELNTLFAIPSIGEVNGHKGYVLGINFYDKNYIALKEFLIQSSIIDPELLHDRFEILKNSDTTALFTGSLTHLSTRLFNSSGEQIASYNYPSLNLKRLHSYSADSGKTILFGLCANDIKKRQNIHNGYKKNDLVKFILNSEGRIIHEELLFNTLNSKIIYQFHKFGNLIALAKQSSDYSKNKITILNFQLNGQLHNQIHLEIEQQEKIQLTKQLENKEVIVITNKKSDSEQLFTKLYQFDASGTILFKKILHEISSYEPIYLGSDGNSIIIFTKQKQSYFEFYRLLKNGQSPPEKPIQSSPVAIQKQYSDLLEDLTHRKETNHNAVAVVIGNSKYKYASEVTFAENDAKAVEQYFIRYFGIPKENIIFVSNATKTDLEIVFGSQTNYKGKLFNYSKAGLSDIYIFYSGHGAPGLETKAGYFVPVDCDPNYVEIGGYSLDLFYQNLSKIPSISTTILLDACFSGASIFRNVSPITVQVKNTEVLQNAIVITSSSNVEVSGWYNEKSHGLFTYYLLNGLKNKTADLDSDGVIRLDELNSYLTDQQSGIPYMARRLHGIKQTPAIFSKDMNRIFYSFK